MKTNIKSIFLLVASLFFVSPANSQVIRKNYREMTTAEKQILVNALIALGPRTTTGTVVNNYATNHSQLTSVLSNQSIHNVNDFLPWHRWFILFFEKELQNTPVTGANKIALPYWDWTSLYYTASPNDQSKSSPLWDASFIGQFNTLWSLGRSATTSTVLGNANQLGDVLLNTNFTNFRSQLELAPFHNAGHNWVSGVMALATSPGDPIFYIHHNMVDKVWQDWHNLGRTSSFTDEILPNKGTSTVPDFPSGVPTVTPSSIIDSRASSVKAWFAENGKVILDKYTVSGVENYNYTGIIEAGTRVIPSKVINGTTVNYLTGTFIVPSGSTCNFVSGGLQMGSAPEAGYIRLVPGFTAAAGSNFSAKINSAYFTDAAIGGRIASVDDQVKNNAKEKAIVFPNPSKGLFYVNFVEDPIQSVSYTVTNQFGLTILNEDSYDNPKVINLSDFPSGIYLLNIKTSLDKVSMRLVIK